MGLDIIVIIVGFLLLIKGADFLIDGSVELAKRFKISEMLIGIVIIGIGTSTPEIIITIKSALNNSIDLIIGNAIGSSICNTLFVIGIASIFHPLRLDKRIEKVHIPLSLLSLIILYLVGNYYIFDRQYMLISLKESIFMVVVVLLYIIYAIFEGKNEDKDVAKDLKKVEKKIGRKTSIFKIIFHIALGIICLNFGADFVVDCAKNIASALHINEAVISLTVVALGTALPEIITCIFAALRGDYNLAMGNVIRV